MDLTTTPAYFRTREQVRAILSERTSRGEWDVEIINEASPDDDIPAEAVVRDECGGYVVTGSTTEGNAHLIANAPVLAEMYLELCAHIIDLAEWHEEWASRARTKVSSPAASRAAQVHTDAAQRLWETLASMSPPGAGR